MSRFIIPIDYHPDSQFYFRRVLALKHPVWLDSGKPDCGYGRYDILTAEPLKISINPSIGVIQREVAALTRHNRELIGLLSELQIPFCGGAIGWFNYEYNHANFGLPADTNPSVFGFFDWSLVQDHHTKHAFLIFLPQCRTTTIKRIKDLILNGQQSDNVTSQLYFQCRNLRADITFDQYQADLAQIRQLILDGETYQINYSQRFQGLFSGSSAAAYLALRKASPSPYSAYIDLLPASTILCLSPEQFVTIDQGNAVTRPIKGTIARGVSRQQDQELAQQLLISEKNRAENLMIVDLLRNDFNKGSQLHSVVVTSLFELQSFANVHHLVSTIEGKLKSEISALEFFINCFPGGSITGAPKRHSMEIIERLERYSRSVYCGSICYLSAAGGRFDSNIAIRTVAINNSTLFCWGGGGIVADSDPEEEYTESIQKIQLLLDTITTAQ